MNNLTRAFTAMQQRGLIAEENFSCCLSCGGEEITEQAGELVRDGEEVVGFVFYHYQDNEDKEAGRNFHLAYGQMHHPELGKIGLTSAAVGRIVCECLAKCHISYEWDGDPENRIRVLVEPIRPTA